MVKDKLKIVATCWHIMHYWDMFNALKNDADFFLITNPAKEWRREEYLASRPIPDNVTFVPYYEKGKYDFAILNVDQQCINPKLGKSQVISDLNAEIQDIPKIFINHATPVYPEFVLEPEMTKEQGEEIVRNKIKQIIGDNLMVVNSYEAVKEWGDKFKNVVPIWHGISEDEWKPLPKEPRIATAVSPGGCDEYYNRMMMNRVAQELPTQNGHILWWAKKNTSKLFRMGDTFTKRENYQKFLGQSLLYLDLTYRTPMNRGRTEAMLSGCCVVQIEGAHDLDRFAKHNENMIIVPNNMEVILNTINVLLESEYEKCVEIGKNARKTAKELFNRKQYRESWLQLINTKILKK